MKFSMTEHIDLIEALREIEENAPKTTPSHMRAVLLEAANALVGLQQEKDLLADRLEKLLEVRAGVMDSESRHLEVSQGIRSNILTIAAELRATGRKRMRAA